jgi:hypothetical protein
MTPSINLPVCVFSGGFARSQSRDGAAANRRRVQDRIGRDVRTPIPTCDAARA